MSDQFLPIGHLQDILATLERLNRFKDVDTILDKLLFEARQISGADAGSIFLIEQDHLTFSYIQNDTLFTGNKGQAEQYTNFQIPIDQASIVGYTALSGDALHIEDAYTIPSDRPYTFNKEFDISAGYRTVSILSLPLKTIDSRLVGVMELINAKDTEGNFVPFSDFSQVSVPLFANNATMAIEKGIMNRELILRMMRMTELRDPKETGAHVQRVGAFSAEIYQRLAEKRGIPAEEIKQYRDLIRLASMLHDIGKVGIEDAILKKPDKLTDEEYAIMKRHPIHGAALFANTTSELDRMSKDISLYHHERWDGAGYPGRIPHLKTLFNNGGRTDHDLPWTGTPLKGKEIPLAARITALADVYDALCSRRSYKSAWPEDRVLDIIRSESGRHFDPEVVDAFFEIQDVIRAIRELYEENR
ncbi:MAG: HD domain-containing protein [Desulfobacterales bacterium]|nr:HD domain-containing protein [Desulfobacterales bacterium]